MGRRTATGCGALRRRKATERGFTLVELLIVLAIIGILSSVAIPNLMAARKKAEVSALMTEARIFQEALVRFHTDFGRFPTAAEFDIRTLEPLVSLGYLPSDSFLRYLRDHLVHGYEVDPESSTTPVKWHIHPRMKPYDKGKYGLKVEGDGHVIRVRYMGKWVDSQAVLPLIR